MTGPLPQHTLDSEFSLLSAALAEALCDISGHVGLAVSGGGDSMALLEIAAIWAEASGQRIHAATVNHGLRPEAAAEAKFVARRCAELGISHTTLHWKYWDGQGNLQAHARAARYDLLGDWARKKGLSAVLIAHTEDDVAETFLIRLRRESGIDGLSRMRMRFTQNGVDWIRPFLSQSRASLRRFLENRGLTWCEDPSNSDATYERVKMRKALIALADAGVSARSISQSSRALLQGKEALTYYAASEIGETVWEDRGDIVFSDGIFDRPIETQRRLFRAALMWVSGRAYAPRRDALEAAWQAARSGQKHTLSGCVLLPSKNGARLTREVNALKTHRTDTTDIWDGRWILSGPHHRDYQIGALGDALSKIPAWREVGLPRTSLISSPAIWDDETLIAAPLAGYSGEWTARIVEDFRSFLLSH